MPVQGSRHVVQDRQLGRRVQVHIQVDIRLPGIDAERDCGQDHQLRTAIPGISGSCSGNRIRLVIIRTIRQMVIVRFRGSPGEDREVKTRFF